MTDGNLPVPFEPDDETQQVIRELVEKLGDNARKLGLYLEGVGVMANPDSDLDAIRNAQMFKDAVKSGAANVAVIGTFTVGDVAWEKRTLDPEQDEIDNEARMILPDPVEELRQKMLRAQEEGKSIFDVGEDE